MVRRQVLDHDGAPSSSQASVTPARHHRARRRRGARTPAWCAPRGRTRRRSRRAARRRCGRGSAGRARRSPATGSMRADGGRRAGSSASSSRPRALAEANERADDADLVRGVVVPVDLAVAAAPEARQVLVEGRGEDVGREERRLAEELRPRSRSRSDRSRPTRPSPARRSIARAAIVVASDRADALAEVVAERRSDARPRRGRRGPSARIRGVAATRADGPRSRPSTRGRGGAR